jgi:hypothetical protein
MTTMCGFRSDASVGPMHDGLLLGGFCRVGYDKLPGAAD